MTTTTTPVDLDNVLAVAGELRRMCSRAAKVGIPVSVFKQESWDAALAHVQDIYRGGNRAYAAMARSTACWPTAPPDLAAGAP